MHSSRMRTARLLPVSPSMHCSEKWGVPAQGFTCPAEGVVPAQGVYLSGGMYLHRGCTCPGGEPAQGGVVPAQGGGVPAQRGGVPAQGVVYLPRGYLTRGCTHPGDVPAQGVPGQVLPPPHEQNSWHKLLKISLCPKLHLRAVNIRYVTIFYNKSN